VKDKMVFVSDKTVPRVTAKDVKKIKGSDEKDIMF